MDYLVQLEQDSGDGEGDSAERHAAFRKGYVGLDSWHYWDSSAQSGAIYGCAVGIRDMFFPYPAKSLAIGAHKGRSIPLLFRLDGKIELQQADKGKKLPLFPCSAPKPKK
jgi:hypothetical protein